MNRILATTLITAVVSTGCVATPAHQTFEYGNSRCEMAYARLKAEGPPLERDLRACLRGGFDLRDPKCFDNRRFNAFSSNTRTVRTCLDAGLLRPSLYDARITTTNLDSIAKLAGKLGDMASAQGL